MEDGDRAGWRVVQLVQMVSEGGSGKRGLEKSSEHLTMKHRVTAINYELEVWLPPMSFRFSF